MEVNKIIWSSGITFLYSSLMTTAIVAADHSQARYNGEESQIPLTERLRYAAQSGDLATPGFWARPTRYLHFAMGLTRSGIH